MKKEQFVQEFQKSLSIMEATMKRKNHDYSGGDGESNPFKNFELVEQLGVATVEQGFLVRMCDKLSRITSLLDNEAKVSDEAIEDTLLDLSNYALIMSLYVKDKRKFTGSNCKPIRGGTCIEGSTSGF